jgi:hypothetical protein
MNTKSMIKKALVAVASVVGAAGAVVLLPEAAVPAVAVYYAKQIVAWGTLAGVVAGALGVKGLNSLNTAKADKRGQVADAEDPR